MKTGASADYIFALFDCWREWPGGSNDMRIGQVFQQEMPCSCVGVPSSLKAAQHVLTWLGGGDLIVKGNFLSASVPIDVAPTVGMASLEYDRMRCARSFAIVGQAKMSDFRQYRCARAFRDDIANSNVGQRAEFPKYASKVLRACSRWQGLLCHGHPIFTGPGTTPGAFERSLMASSCLPHHELRLLRTPAILRVARSCYADVSWRSKRRNT